MLKVARRRLPTTRFVRGDALDLPCSDRSFERVFTGHFYGHLQKPERERFLAEARRVAPELVVVDAAVRPDQPRVVPRQARILSDGSHWEVYKRYFSGAELAAELGGGDILYEGRWFLVVTSFAVIGGARGPACPSGQVSRRPVRNRSAST